MADRSAKATQPVTGGEELADPAAKDICCELSGEAAVPKVARVPLVARTRTGGTSVREG